VSVAARAAALKEHAMPSSYSPEEKAAVRALVEETTMTVAAIADSKDMPRSTVGEWIVRERWRRPEGAFVRKPIPKDHHAAVQRMLSLGVCPDDLALVMDRDPDVVRRWRPPRAAAIAAAAEEGLPLAAQAAALHAALTTAVVGRDELLRHTPQALALVMAETVIAKLNPDRKAQALARIAAANAKMPAEAPAPRAALEDAYDGPGTYDETNALIEELAQRLAEFGVLREDGGLPDEDVARAETLPQ
jgi:hypothetical protein